MRDLGPQTAAFKPDIANLVAGIILGLLAIAGGIGLVVWMIRFVISRGGNLQWMQARDKEDLPWFLVGLVVFAGFALVGLGVEFWRRARRVRFFRLVTCRDGFLCIERGTAEVFKWDQIESVVETIKQEYFPLKMGLKYLLPVGRSHSYLVRRRGGGQVQFDAEVVKQLGKLKRIIQQEAERRGIPWKIEEKFL